MHVQLDPQGMVTAMDDKGFILGTWAGTSSMWDLAACLTALGLRCKALGKVCMQALGQVKLVACRMHVAYRLMWRVVLMHA